MSVINNKLVINCIFSIGHRCTPVYNIKDYNLRKFSGPFDYVIVDLKSAMKIINNNFEDYLNDIVIFCEGTHNRLILGKNTTDVKEKFSNLTKIRLNDDDRQKHVLFFNQNYVDDNIDSNVYNWKTICLFYHHSMAADCNDLSTLKRRCERFQQVNQKYNNTMALFHISGKFNCDNEVDYMNEITIFKKINNINCILIIICCVTNIENKTYYNDVDKCLFIFKHLGVDEDELKLTYKNEIDIIKSYFDFNIIELNEI